jgi:hypothetical protein
MVIFGAGMRLAECSLHTEGIFSPSGVITPYSGYAAL